MKKLLIALAVLAGAAGLSRGASLAQGTQEVVVEGLFDGSTAAGDQSALQGRYGQFIIDNVEAGVAAAFNDNDLGTVYDIGVFGEYNVDLGTELVPFFGAEVSYRYLDLEEIDTDDSIVLTISAGAKYFLAENVAIRVGLNASLASEDVYANDEDVEDNDFNLSIGMAYYIP
jgi:hypothetical protein